MTTSADATTETEAPEDIGWAILELMGHRRLGGYIREQVVAGAAFLRIDIPQEPPASQLYSAQAVYAITPTTEAMARAVAGRNRVEPVSRWELPAPEPEPDIEDADEVDHDDPPPDELEDPEHLACVSQWIEQGRSDAWIAHQYEVPIERVTELRLEYEFKPAPGVKVDADDEDHPF